MWWKPFVLLFICVAGLAFLGWAAFRSVADYHIGHGKMPDELKAPKASGSWFQVAGEGCCLDGITSVQWQADEIDLKSSKPQLPVLKILMPLVDWKGRLELNQGLTSFARSHGHLWIVDRARGRFLDYFANDESKALPGSEDMGLAQGLIDTPFRYRSNDRVRDLKDGDRLLLTSRPRPQAPAYSISRTSQDGYVVQAPPLDERSVAVYRSDSDTIRPVLEGLPVYAPTGIALSPNGDTLYVADERATELVWLELRLDDFCNDKWVYQGVLARFPLKPSERGIFRGLLVHSTGVVIGSAPGGLFFYTPDGKLAGKISTRDEISYLIPGLYQAETERAECIYAAVGPRLCFLPIQGSFANLSASTQLCEPPPPRPVQKSLQVQVQKQPSSPQPTPAPALRSTGATRPHPKPRHQGNIPDCPCSNSNFK
jgi:hypothetical protein